MKHLSPEQLLDVAEGHGAAAAAAHLAACDVCRAEVESIAETLRLARRDLAPEPSPLFWPGLASRIGHAVRREDRGAAARKAWAWRLAPAGALAVIVAAVGISVLVRSATSDSRPAVSSSLPAAPPQAAAETPADAGAEDDPSWLLVSDLSADVTEEDADEFGAFPPAGAVERALWHLDEAERIELTRILQEEMAPRGTTLRQGPGA